MMSSAVLSTELFVKVAGTRLFVVSRGAEDKPPLIVLHGGPGLDHHEFADYLDPLTDSYRLLLVDLRAQGRSDRDVPDETLTLQQMAVDVSQLAASLGLVSYAVLGHSYGSFVALQHACDAPGAAVGTIVSSGVPSQRFLDGIDERLAAFEPAQLREQVTASWAAEGHVETAEDFATLMSDQLPWHFADPHDPRIADYAERTAGTVYAPRVLRLLSSDGYGAPEMADRLGDVSQPVLALGGRHDRTCPPEAAELIADLAPRGELRIFEQSGHMTYVEETEAYLAVVADFLARAFAAADA